MREKVTVWDTLGEPVMSSPRQNLQIFLAFSALIRREKNKQNGFKHGKMAKRAKNTRFLLLAEYTLMTVWIESTVHTT